MELNFCTQCGKLLTYKLISDEGEQKYYFAPKNLIMAGFIAYVKAREFGSSNEVDDLIWVDLDKAVIMVERENNYSMMNFVTLAIPPFAVLISPNLLLSKYFYLRYAVNQLPLCTILVTDRHLRNL